MSATSQTSTKLIHGGLRYLEHGDFRLVRESLHERTWWIKQAPSLVHPIELVLPIYKHHSRPRWLVGTGLTLYDLLAGSQNIGRHQWHSLSTLQAQSTPLRTNGLRGAYTFFDAQMDDYALGMWVARQVAERGVKIHEQTPVLHISPQGDLTTPHGTTRYNCIVNVAGPWAKQLLDQSGIPSAYDLDLVRGSHLELRGTLPSGYFLQVPNESRIIFALPYKDHILLGTTEVNQTLEDPIVCTDQERNYLLKVYNTYFVEQKTEDDIIGTFAGVRPLIRSNKPATQTTREYAIERTGAVVTVFGGKWTTARVLGEKVARVVDTVVQSSP